MSLIVVGSCSKRKRSCQIPVRLLAGWTIVAVGTTQKRSRTRLQNVYRQLLFREDG